MEDFVEKTAEELAKLDANELAKYYNDLNAYKQAEIDKKIEEKASKEDIDTLKEEISGLKDIQLKEMQRALKEMGLKLEKAPVFKHDGVTDFQSSLVEALEKNKQELEEFSQKTQGGVKIVVKAAGDTFLQSDTTGGSIPQQRRLTTPVMINRRANFIRNYINTETLTGADTIEWVEQINIEESTGGTLEGAVKNDLHFEWVVRSEKARKRTAKSKVSTEMLRRVDMMQAHINNEIVRSLNDDVEQQILRGNGTAPNFSGIVTDATAYSAGTFADTIEGAHEMDVLITAISQVKDGTSVINGTNQKAGYFPNLIAISVAKYTQIKLLKDTQGRYLFPRDNGMLMVDGIPVVASHHMQDDEFLVMDGNQVTFWIEDNLSLDIGFVNDDFAKNLRTLLGEIFGFVVIPHNRRTAIVRGTFTAAKAALETP